MPNETIKDILMRRDNMSASEAQELINEAREAFDEYLEENNMEGAGDICQEYFGLEPDYLDEFI